jgi:DNA-binding transcriptional regulator GbsR (MarR family)
VTDLGGVNDEEMLALKRPIIDACIKSAQKNGWSDAMGLLRGTLFLESEPMSLDTLAEKTGYSKTTVRSNMNCLENIGIVRRVVAPLEKPHRYKQYRYALVNDAEAMRPVILSAAKEEIHLILQALQQFEKNLKGSNVKDAELKASLVKAVQFYEEMSRILDLIGEYSSKELIAIFESKKKWNSRKSNDSHVNKCKACGKQTLNGPFCSHCQDMRDELRCWPK